MTPKELVATLTPREREVVRLILDGHKQAGIAAELGLSIKTVQAHRHHISVKLNTNGPIEMVRCVVAGGIPLFT